MTCAHCAHCHRELAGRRRTFCDERCKMRAYRRRRAGLAEDALVGRGRRGRVPLEAETRSAQIAGLVEELQRIRATLDAGAATDAALELLEKNRHLEEAVGRLEAAAAAAVENRLEQDGRLERGTHRA